MGGAIWGIQAHTLSSILRARILAIACGYEDGNDLDTLRSDPGFKLACGRLPDSGADLRSQPTISRWENAPTLREIIRLMGDNISFGDQEAKKFNDFNGAAAPDLPGFKSTIYKS